jgi:hypothetical protein
MIVRHPEYNAEQSNDIDSTFLPRIRADSESEEMYSFGRCSDDDEDWDIQFCAARDCSQRDDHHE